MRIAKIHRVEERYALAASEYKRAHLAAVDFGCRKLEADVLSEQSRLALTLGDAETARLRAMGSLQICNELAMGLRVTTALVDLGKATLLEGDGDLDLGRAYLDLARTMAKRQGYWLRYRDAEKTLGELGE
ncbi:MAG: hypothetical protein V3T86_12720 [Planctomycetota bacterium]